MSGAAIAAAHPNVPLPQPFIDEPRGAADPGSDLDRRRETVFCAGSALHAGIAVNYPCPAGGHGENLMGTDLHAPATADAGILLQLQGCHIFQIPVPFHKTSISCYRKIPA